jgi:glutamine synthetase
MAGLIAPVPNSYDRLKPESLSGYWANWGVDHRSVSVRVSAEDGSAARIEHRVADCAVSPYVAMAAALNAARLGVEKGYVLPPQETADGLSEVNTSRHIPDSLPEALDALEADTDLVEAVGRDLIDNYLAIKRAELDEVKDLSPAELFDYYAPFI